MGNKTSKHALPIPPAPSSGAMKRRAPTSDGFAGMLCGEAVGDFLGLITEGQPTTLCMAYLADDVMPCIRDGVVSEALKKRASDKGMPLGQYSDDTQMTREMMVSIVECAEVEGR